ncbi:MAG: GAF and ANTAR domain-containing protein [Aeromicrobium sp.]
MSPIDDRSLQQLLDDLADTPTTGETVQQAVAFAAQTLATPYAGATVIRDHVPHLETVSPTHGTVRRADELQDALDEGPCIDAAVESRTVVSNDLASDRRWPSWGPRAAELGLESVLSSEIHANGRRVGALIIYGSPGHAFTREHVEVGAVLAQQVSVALRSAQRITGLRAALDARTVVGQAQGALMERYGVDADRAFSILRRLSQERDVRLVQVARAVLLQALDGAGHRGLDDKIPRSAE